MQKTLPQLYSHLDGLRLQLRWALYAFYFSKNTSPELVLFQTDKIKQIRTKIDGTKALIYYAEMQAVDLSILIGYQVQQQGQQAVINFQQPVNK